MLVGLGVAASVGFQLHADFRPADMATVKMQPHPVGPIGGWTDPCLPSHAPVLPRSSALCSPRFTSTIFPSVIHCRSLC